MSAEPLEPDFSDLLGGKPSPTEKAFIALLRFSAENARSHGISIAREAMLLNRAYRAIYQELEKERASERLQVNVNDSQQPIILK